MIILTQNVRFKPVFIGAGIIIALLRCLFQDWNLSLFPSQAYSRDEGMRHVCAEVHHSLNTPHRAA